jgi:hypothetical protein
MIYKISILIPVLISIWSTLISQDNNDCFVDIIKLDSIISIDAINIENSISEDITYSNYKSYIFFTNYSSILRQSNNQTLILYRFNLNKKSLDNYKVEIPKKIVKKNTRVKSLFCDNQTLILSFRKKLLVYKLESNKKFEYFKSISIRPTPMYINKTGERFILYHHYKFKGPYLFLKDFYVYSYDSMFKKKIILSYKFNNPEFTFLYPHNWITNNQNSIFLCQTTDYKIDMFDDVLNSKCSYNIPNKRWRKLSDESYSELESLKVRGQISFLTKYDNLINRIISINSSDSILLLEYTDPSNANYVVGYFDILKVSSDSFRILFSNQKDYLKGNWKDTRITKDNIPFLAPSFPHYFLSGDYLIQFRDGPNLSPIGLTSEEFSTKVENAILKGEMSIFSIYLFSIKLD